MQNGIVVDKAKIKIKICLSNILFQSWAGQGRAGTSKAGQGKAGIVEIPILISELPLTLAS